MRTLNELIRTTKSLQVSIQAQQEEARNIRRLLEECEGCKPKVGCARASPCFPGVQCHDTAEGMRCGACPRR